MKDGGPAIKVWISSTQQAEVIATKNYAFMERWCNKHVANGSNERPHQTS